MTLAALPDYDYLPAPLWLITVLHVLTLALHFLAMNFMVGGLVVVIFGRLDDRWSNPTVKRYLKLFPSVMAATVTLGVAPLLFAQLVYGPMLYSAAIISGWLWILIPIVVIVAYYFLYGAAFAKEGNPRVGTWVVLALVGLIYVSIVQSSVFSMAEHPELQEQLYEQNQAGTVLNPELGSWIVRWLHMLTGAVTVGGFFFGWIGAKDEQAFATGKRFYLWGFAIASVMGIAYLATLGDLMSPFMKSAGIWAVLVGLVAGLGALHLYFTRKFAASAAALLVSMLGMVTARHVLRDIALRGTFEAGAWRVEPQWGVFGIFLVCFVIALGLVAWMLKLFLTDRGGTEIA